MMLIWIDVLSEQVDSCCDDINKQIKDHDINICSKFDTLSDEVGSCCSILSDKMNVADDSCCSVLSAKIDDVDMDLASCCSALHKDITDVGEKVDSCCSVLCEKFKDDTKSETEHRVMIPAAVCSRQKLMMLIWILHPVVVRWAKILMM